MQGKQKYLCGKRILPQAISRKTDIAGLIDNMDAYNGGRLRAACRLLKEKYSAADVTVGMSLAGALTPAGLGPSAIIPLMNHGYVDWITATGANMYHDMHYAFNLPMFRGSHTVDDLVCIEIRVDPVTGKDLGHLGGHGGHPLGVISTDRVEELPGLG